MGGKEMKQCLSLDFFSPASHSHPFLIHAVSLLVLPSICPPLPPSSTYFISPYTLLTQTEAGRAAGWMMSGRGNIRSNPVREQSKAETETNSRALWIKDDRSLLLVPGQAGRTMKKEFKGRALENSETPERAVWKRWRQQMDLFTFVEKCHLLF